MKASDLFLLICKKINNFLSHINLKITPISNQDRINSFFEKLFIYWTGHDLVRVGEKGDGGYLVPNILHKVEYCLSPGVGPTSTFEDQLLKYNIKSFLADGTVNYTGNHHFIKKNLNTYNDENNITIQQMMSEIKEITNNKSLLLQMDIEGSEIEVLLSTDQDTLKKFKILVIEFHHFKYLSHPTILKVYNAIFNKLLKDFTICHIHPNTSLGTTIIKKKKIPDVLEITFLNNEELKTKEPIQYTLPCDLDTKNFETDEEIILPEFFYKK
ncbi:FkbM family methyltransferase [Candidatus Pelagibacter sp.]|nr:FkbM family methyltransferase [Candidatus Pelagibacter sp.]